MKYRRRIYYSAVQRAEIWDRWQRGESMSSIGRRFDRQSSSVFSVISPTGGIRPADWTRGGLALMYREASPPPHCQPLEMRSCSSCSVRSEPAGSALPPKSPVGAEADDLCALGLLWPFPVCFAFADSAVPRHRQTKQATPNAISCSTPALH